MVWEKIVRIVAVGKCPRCGNGGFDLEPGEDLDDLHALVRCGACGHVCPLDHFISPVDGDPKA
jgi:ferredoxin